ncbi:hypothetical protein QBC36DRAFT_78575 [Triangularia setosa]|uniref:Uncharacterized protein n=1 Tax=Triangularia setosa TaxID=2587417 RepID=A0AAN6WCF3_9PEZI|nr:hypothetical protein QBC36DRAFT_78575 [Podospora setosa]
MKTPNSTIIAGSKRGIQRVDVGLYGYRFKSKQLAEIAKNVVVAVVVVSSLGPTKVNEGYLHMLIENQFPEEKQQEILGILLKARKDVLPPHYRE